MKILEKYDPTKTYMTPSSALATPAFVLEQFPSAAIFTHIVETDVYGEMMFSFENLSALRTMHELDMTLTEDEAIVELQRLMNLVPEVVVSAEERIAAALEYQNLLNM